MKVIILDNLHKGARYNSHWTIHIPDLITSWGYETLVFQSDYVRRLNVPDRAKMLSSKLLDKFVPYIVSDKIKDDDIIILPDARDYIAFPISEMLKIRNLKTKLIGFWQSGIYYSDGYEWKDYPKSYRTQMTFFERALSGIYDLNLMNSDLQYTRFKNSYTLNRNNKNIERCGFPYNFLIDADEEFVKEDIVVYNAGPQDEMNHKVFEYVKGEFPNYQYYVCNTEEFTNQEYQQLMKRSKVLFNTNLSESNPWTILESMMYGAIPILPNYKIYHEMFPDLAKYDRKLLNPPYLNLIRNDEQILEPLQDYMEKYETNREKLLIPTREKVLKEHFNSKDFKDLLCRMTKK